MLHFCCWRCPFIAVVIVFAYEEWSWSAVVVCRMLLLLFYSGCWCCLFLCAAAVFFDCWCCLFVVDRVVWSTSQSLRVPLMTRKWRRPATDMALSWCTLMSGCFITEWGAEVYRPLPSLCSLKTAADVQCTLFTFNWKNYWGSVSRWRIVRCWIRFDCVHVHSMNSKQFTVAIKIFLWFINFFQSQ